MRFATIVGAHGASAVTSPTRPRRRRRCARVARRDVRGGRVELDRGRPARSPAAPRRSPARRCPRPNRPARVRSQLLQQLQAELRRRVRRSAEGRARVDRRVPSPSSQGGRIVNAPTVTGARCVLPGRAQPGSTGVRDDATTCRRPARNARRTAARPRRPRTRPRRPSVDLLRAGGQHRLQAGERDLGVLGADPDAEPDHPASARLSFASMPSGSRRLSSVSDVGELLRAGRAACGSAGAG